MSSLSSEKLDRIKAAITDYPDFPKPGIVFKDIMGILKSPSVFNDTIDCFHEEAKGLCSSIDVVVGLEARGFLFGPSLAQRLNCGFVPVRKAGKLPGACIAESYVKEYGEDKFELQAGSIAAGARVLIVDDLVAVGGTMEAAVRLVHKAGGRVVGCLAIVELGFLNGRSRLPAEVPLRSLIRVDSE